MWWLICFLLDLGSSGIVTGVANEASDYPVKYGLEEMHFEGNATVEEVDKHVGTTVPAIGGYLASNKKTLTKAKKPIAGKTNLEFVNFEKSVTGMLAGRILDTDYGSLLVCFSCHVVF